MALLNISLCSKLPPNPPLSLLHKPHPSSLSLQTQLKPSPNLFSPIAQSVAKVGFVALLSSSLFFVHPALAFKSILRQANFKGAKLLGASFFDADLTGLVIYVVIIQYRTPVLIETCLLFSKSLIVDSLCIILLGADLSDADLRGADFSLASVTKANLSNANLEGATLTGNTSFKGSKITGADFTDVPLRDDQREYLCTIADGVNPTTGNATRDTLLCN
ncbi:hypothetical protein RHGRI_007904 [Rhododendron griersonianum]|uniref:Uncharacterized protein n=1 Tax=Rhododendron griersonianum TaxID=479676 RepID=A0AAV6KYH3_9ERIC|nr:hypothetical protein RHGRI_007904 [Rhododendron griersonianum]